MNNSAVSFAQLRKRLLAVDDGFIAEVPEGWRQGRTAYGGITAGLALTAASLEFPDLPPLRSMLLNFTGPVFGNPILRTVCLRQGKSVTTVQVTVYSEGKVAAQVIFTFGGSRQSSLAIAGPSKTLDRSPAEYEEFAPARIAKFVPEFLQNFDVRLVAGSRSVSGADEGYVRVVARHKDVDSRTGVDSLVAIADVLPPAAFTMARQVAPVSSVTWILNMLTDDPLTSDGWWHIDSRMTAAQDGYSSQQMNVWSIDGTLVAEGMQSVALFF